MPMPFNPEEIDDLDESLLETMDREELSDFREKLQETMDEMESFPPDPDKEEDAYYEWKNWRKWIAKTGVTSLMKMRKNTIKSWLSLKIPSGT